MSVDLARARMEVTASSAGGAPFLFSFGLTIFLTGLLALSLPTKTAALILLFQGNAALPLAFWLQRRMAWGELSPENPLRPLSIQLAMSLCYMAGAYAIAGAMLSRHARTLGRVDRGSALSRRPTVLSVRTADKELDVV